MNILVYFKLKSFANKCILFMRAAVFSKFQTAKKRYLSRYKTAELIGDLQQEKAFEFVA